MAQWKNFNIWRGRLPHWRADGVMYYVTFRHRRDLNEDERNTLLKRLLSPDGRKIEIVVLCVLPTTTEMMFTVSEDNKGGVYELSDVIEKAKARAGKDIIKASGEKWAPFYNECYDRIIRDDAELEETFLKIVESPCHAGLCEDADSWPTLFTPDPEAHAP